LQLQQSKKLPIQLEGQELSTGIPCAELPPDAGCRQASGSLSFNPPGAYKEEESFFMDIYKGIKKLSSSLFSSSIK